MRLSKIKLAGFKSFVDPTTIPLPSNLIGIVGPNGCGKSNVIDAVRWVMGESSARHLRGDSMADVVFSGSSSRKPVGQALVELVFDNSDGGLGGEYAKYSEISIKRCVTRDGQSTYYLNGTRCRRRDITDIFLGTGLGPRSYAIIEQGTISRLIEAKPEELRVFIEEAAGISRYKERRRETENRIRHTRDNLDRLNDLRDEVEKQLNRLQRQARTAERYKVLKEEERLLRAQLQALRWQGVNEQSRETETAIREKETGLEAAVARQRGIESEIEKRREMHVEATDRFNDIQSRFYSIGADIARLEQSIQHARERRQQQQNDLAQLESDWASVQQQLEFDRNKISETSAALEEIGPTLAEALATEQASTQKLHDAEKEMHAWQTGWDEFNQQAQKPSQTAEVERTRIEHLEQEASRLQQQLQKLNDELASQSSEQQERELRELEQRVQQSAQAVAAAQERLQDTQEAIRGLRERIGELRQQVDVHRERVQTLQNRHASLTALQQAALGKQEGAVSDWLSGQQLDGAPRLAEELTVEQGWERAAECVLGFNLEAVCVDGVDALSTRLQELQGGTLTLFDTRHPVQGETHKPLPRLTDKVRAPWSLDALLGNVYVAERLDEALALREQLAAHESVVTRDGIWLGRSWLRVVRDRDERSGVLEREQELKTVTGELQQATAELERLQAELDGARTELQTREGERDSAQQALNAANRDHASNESALSARRAGLEKIRERRSALEQERAEAEARRERHARELAEARTRLQAALEAVAGFEQQREQHISARDDIRARLDVARSEASRDREAAHQIKLRAETARTELNSYTQALERMEQQMQQLSSRREELQKAISESEAPLQKMAAELDAELEKRVTIENSLNEARKALETVDFEMRELEEQRTATEEEVQTIRSALEQLRIGWQEYKVRRQTLEEQIAEAGFDLQRLCEELPPEATEEHWSEQVIALENKITRLGPINLAAIEEFEQESERKKYLDEQHKDITEALETLENAIRKIDKETRTRFKETFDQINSGMQSLFPRLFGGGHAYLELTGDDLLEAGVTVMARPPGKRNSTIHLLSGGEKALTAVALVFSIFELNPAPFCMLDEVDAPLDDANVGRYSAMLQEKSETTQFIFISHNKLTMEIAHQLNGVTMNEPGVSHLVAVDVEQAVEMAAV
ncbi:MAG TPA: chromosome segregation protein SMC [Gammaproteobacteria bacterium]|nr:chromosome segregation protein SMC [Gammaproteobacteria bacterium]